MYVPSNGVVLQLKIYQRLFYIIATKHIPHNTHYSALMWCTYVSYLLHSPMPITGNIHAHMPTYYSNRHHHHSSMFAMNEVPWFVTVCHHAQWSWRSCFKVKSNQREREHQAVTMWLAKRHNRRVILPSLQTDKKPNIIAQSWKHLTISRQATQTSDPIVVHRTAMPNNHLSKRIAKHRANSHNRVNNREALHSLWNSLDLGWVGTDSEISDQQLAGESYYVDNKSIISIFLWGNRRSTPTVPSQQIVSIIPFAKVSRTTSQLFLLLNPVRSLRTHGTIHLRPWHGKQL